MYHHHHKRSSSPRQSTPPLTPMRELAILHLLSLPFDIHTPAPSQSHSRPQPSRLRPLEVRSTFASLSAQTHERQQLWPTTRRLYEQLVPLESTTTGPRPRRTRPRARRHTTDPPATDNEYAKPKRRRSDSSTANSPTRKRVRIYGSNSEPASAVTDYKRFRSEDTSLSDAYHEHITQGGQGKPAASHFFEPLAPIMTHGPFINTPTSSQVGYRSENADLPDIPTTYEFSFQYPSPAETMTLDLRRTGPMVPEDTMLPEGYILPLPGATRYHASQRELYSTIVENDTEISGLGSFDEQPAPTSASTEIAASGQSNLANATANMPRKYNSEPRDMGYLPYPKKDQKDLTE